MNWSEMEKDDLLKAVSVLELVPLRAGVPSSDFIKMVPRKNSLEMSLSSVVTAVVRSTWKPTLSFTGDLFIDRGLFSAFVLAGKNWKGNFKLSLDEGRLYVRQGSRKAEFSLRHEPLGGYGKWMDRDGLKEIKLSDELKKLLLASNSCATGDPSMPHLNCVYIGGRLVLSTNATSLFVGIRQKEDALKIPFPVGIIPLLGGELVDSVGVDGDRVLLDCGCGFIEGTVSALAKRDFPKRSVVETIKKAREWPTLVRLPAEKLTRMFTRLVGYLGTIKREDWLVSLNIEDEKVTASVTVQQGQFQESMAVEGLKATLHPLQWPLDKIMPVMEYISSETELLRVRADEKKKTPYLLSGGGVEMIVGRKV